MGGNAEHDGNIILNFTTGRRRESSSVAFGKETGGNGLLGIAFSGAMPIVITKGQASFEGY
ncbi:TPA: hypothetical protein HA361_01940 [Candidatus Woesearchaeota archaeon]|nr:hypothetical protein [Candidatus Woesearchaeota archaeon]